MHENAKYDMEKNTQQQATRLRKTQTLFVSGADVLPVVVCSADELLVVVSCAECRRVACAFVFVRSCCCLVLCFVVAVLASRSPLISDQ